MLTINNFVKDKVTTNSTEICFLNPDPILGQGLTLNQ